jgi:hypothetical protein
LTALSHSIKNSDSKRSHLQLRSQLPNTHEKSIVGNIIYAMGIGLLVNLASINEILKATKDSNISCGKLDDEFNSLITVLRLVQFGAVVGGLSTQEILLNAKRDLIGTYEKDCEDGMWLAVVS